MRKATKLTATMFGISAGLAGIEHGIFEILQGKARPESLMIASMGPPCNPEEVWYICEPAMTILPSFISAGILTILLSLFTLVWVIKFMGSNNGGGILILLSIGLLLTGGGIFPPFIGLVGGIFGLKINQPGNKLPDQIERNLLRFTAHLWPWPLVLFLGWIFAGQWIFGYLYNDFMMSTGFIFPILIIGLLVVSIISAQIHDKVKSNNNL